MYNTIINGRRICLNLNEMFSDQSVFHEKKIRKRTYVSFYLIMLKVKFSLITYPKTVASH